MIGKGINQDTKWGFPLINITLDFIGKKTGKKCNF